MEYYALPEFEKDISKLIHDEKWDLAIDKITKAIRDAQNLRDEEGVCYLYSNLAGVYFMQERVNDALNVLEEVEAKYPNSVLAKYLYLEKLFWYSRDYEQAIQKAESVIALVQMHLNYYNKSLYLKGLAHAELGQFQQAIEMLKQTDYYDLALAEKLVNHGVGLTECRDFLLRALERYKVFQERGEDVGALISRIEALMKQLKERDKGPGRNIQQ
jgi:tetratricopeptide (TPR) repeat protein